MSAQNGGELPTYVVHTEELHPAPFPNNFVESSKIIPNVGLVDVFGGLF